MGHPQRIPESRIGTVGNCLSPPTRPPGGDAAIVNISDCRLSLRRPGAATHQSPVRSRPHAPGGGVVRDRDLLALQRLAGNSAVTSLARRDTRALGTDDINERQVSPVHDVISRAGHPLATQTRLHMENRLQANFESVRLHVDAPSAQSLGASAYTVGDHIVLHPRVSPHTASGTHTLAHELSHVVQQRAGRVSGRPASDGIRVSQPGDQFEREAARRADRVVARTRNHEPIETRRAMTSGENLYPYAKRTILRTEPLTVQRFCGECPVGPEKHKDPPPALRPHHYFVSQDIGVFPEAQVPTAPVAMSVFKDDFMCSRVGKVGDTSVLTPSLPILGSNPVVNVAETSEASEASFLVRTRDKHFFRGSAKHTIRVLPAGPGLNRVVYDVEGNGPPEGESPGLARLNEVAAPLIWRGQAHVFRNNLHNTKLPKEGGDIK